MTETTATEKMLAEINVKVKEKNLPPLLNREFVTMETGGATGDTIRVMQWNMLAQGMYGKYS